MVRRPGPGADARLVGAGASGFRELPGVLGAWLEAYRATCVVMKPPAVTVRCAKRFTPGVERGARQPACARAASLRRPANWPRPNTIDAVVTAAHGTTFLDLHTLPPRSAFLDQLADLLVLRERNREAQISLRQSAIGVQDPVPWTEGQRCSCFGALCRDVRLDGGLSSWRQLPRGPGVDVTRAPGKRETKIQWTTGPQKAGDCPREMG